MTVLHGPSHTKITVKRIHDFHGDGRVWMVMIPNNVGWWTHYYLRRYTEALTLVRKTLNQRTTTT